jgi:MarR family transcriptional regulator, organic hydroperoxide resistance regulator
MNRKFKLNKSLGFLLSKTNASMRIYFNKAIKENGLDATAEQWGLLNIIHEFPGIIQSNIAEKSMKDRTNITRMLDVLEKNRFIERKSDKDDRRLYRIYITDKGESLLKSLIPVAMSVNEKASYGLNKNELKIFIEILYKIYKNTRGY